MVFPEEEMQDLVTDSEDGDEVVLDRPPLIDSDYETYHVSAARETEARERINALKHDVRQSTSNPQGMAGASPPGVRRNRVLK